LQLPDFPPMSAETLEAIGERHNLHAEEISPLKDVGIFNSIYLVGSEYVLRVPRVAPLSSPPSARSPSRCPPPALPG
jgi:hypothetical protein